MDHSGRAFKLALRHVFWGLVYVLALLSAGVVAIFLGHLISAISWGLVGFWAVFSLVVFFLFRDPDPAVPSGLPKAVLAPSHGRVLEVEQTAEPAVMRGACRRISINLGWRDLHIGKSPVDGIVTFCQETQASDARSGGPIGSQLLVGLAPREVPREIVAVRLIAGRFPRKTVAWARTGDILERGHRLGMMQFGSRCDLFLPLSAEVQVKPGDAVRGGETILACFA